MIKFLKVNLYVCMFPWCHWSAALKHVPPTCSHSACASEASEVGALKHTGHKALKSSSQGCLWSNFAASVLGLTCAEQEHVNKVCSRTMSLSVLGYYNRYTLKREGTRQTEGRRKEAPMKRRAKDVFNLPLLPVPGKPT